MTLGVHVTTRTSPPTGGVPTATDTLFVAAITDAGDTGVPIEVRDIADFETKVAGRTAGNIELWDVMDVFFREGGKRCLISRGANDADLGATLGVFGKELGPGQVGAVGYAIDATNATGLGLLDHASNNNRFAVVDAIDSGVPAELKVPADVLADVDVRDGYCGVFGPWVEVPPPAGVTGATSRKVQPLPVIAALMARVDESGNPNQAAAGRYTPLQYVTDLAYDFTLDQMDDLLDSGVNSMAEVYGVLQNYGFQTVVSETEDNPYWQANCSRMRMALVAESAQIGENYMFKPIDGKGALANAFKGDLTSMLLDYYNLGALYGEVSQEAFAVEVGVSVNTPETIAQGRLRAVASVVLTLHAKAVEIELVTVPIGGTV